MDLTGHSLKLYIRDEVIAVGVIATEDLLDAAFGLEVSHLRCNPIDEDIQGNRLLDFQQAIDELEDKGVNLKRSELIQSG